jgi:cell division protein ZapA
MRGGVGRMAEMQYKSAAEQSRAEMEAQEAARESGAVVVEIYDQIYQLRGPDAIYIERLAGLVDDKMRRVSAGGATVDSLRVAVLTALNLADELETLKARFEALSEAQKNTQSIREQAQSSLRSRAGSLAGMLDEVLLERRAS